MASTADSAPAVARGQAPPVTAAVLGSVRAEVGGVAVDLGGPRQRSVLARLVAEGGHVVSTDRLVDDLWDGEPPPKALAALQVHVSHLRRALEPRRSRREAPTVLVSAPPGYALRLPREAVDAWRFEDLVGAAADEVDPRRRRGLLERALGCWSGHAFAESADTAWAAPAAARLEGLRLAVVERRAEVDLELGEAARAVADLQHHVQDHPGREEAVRLLALGLYRTGRQGDALAVLRASRDHLAEELGIDPGPALRALEADVLAQSPSLDAARPGPSRTAPLTAAEPWDGVRSPRQAPAREPEPVPAQDPVALGRERELAAVLTAARSATAAGAVRLVWVAGEAGDGKTTLVDAASAALGDRGWTTTWGRCPEVEGAPPGWAWHEVAEDLGVDGLAGLAVVGEPASPFLLARGTARLVAERARSAPVLVVLDDLHRADGLTLQLLRQVVDHLDGAPVVVLATFRPSEAGRELAAARAALAASTAEHLVLAGLDRDGVAALARRAGLTGGPGGGPDPDEVDLLVERTGGNPLFVRELARLLAAGGARTRGGLPLQVGGPVETVPEGVAAVLRARLARLPASSSTALRRAAVLGREVDLEVLAALGRHGLDDLLDQLEPPVLAGLLEESAPGRVRFTHALVRDTLYGDTPALRRTRLHAEVVEVLERLAPTEVDALAHHALASLAPATARRALRHVLAAARAATALSAPDEAARLHRAALRALAVGGGGDVPEEVLLRVEAVTAAARAGDAVGARELQRDAVVLAGGPGGSRELVVAVLTAWRTPLVWSVRQLSEVDPVLLDPLREMLAEPDLDPVERVRLLHALFLEVEGADTPAALACSEELLRRARRLPDDVRAPLLCAALNARAYAALGPDLADERADLAAELVATAAASGLTDFQATGLWLVFLSEAAAGDLRAAQRAVDAAVELCATGQLGHLLGVLGIWRGVVDVLAGRLEEGLERYTRTAAGLAERGGASAEVMGLVGRFVVAWALGDLSPLVDELVAVNELAGRTVTPMAVIALLDAGRVEEARAVQALRAPVDRGYYWLGMTAVAAHAAARLGDRPAARAAYEELLPWAGRTAGIDSGTLPVGPVDDALAACAELLGEPAAAARHREGAARVRAQLRAALREVGVVPV